MSSRQNVPDDNFDFLLALEGHIPFGQEDELDNTLATLGRLQTGYGPISSDLDAQQCT